MTENDSVTTKDVDKVTMRTSFDKKRSDYDRRQHDERERLIRRLCDPCSHRKTVFFRVDMTKKDRVRRS